MDGPQPNGVRGEVPRDLVFGQRFTVTRRAGGTLAAASLARIPGGLYARCGDGEIVRVLEGDVDWGSFVAEPAEPGEGLSAGDGLLIESAAGSLRGELVRLAPGRDLVLRLPHGAQLPFPVRPIRRAYLLLRRATLSPGDVFEVSSRSGNVYSGFVVEQLGEDRIKVELELGQRVELRLSRLRLETASIRVPIPVEHLRGERAALAPAPRTRSARLSARRVQLIRERER